ncbi:hypothetical protein L195_g031825, partial [Trifolium pratense]
GVDNGPGRPGSGQKTPPDPVHGWSTAVHTDPFLRVGLDGSTGEVLQSIPIRF